jgi:peptidoglycan/LPS O-acetylase OafA/YrhL
MSATTTTPVPVRFTDSSASLLFDLLRGCAALIVVIEHWRNLFFIDFQQLSAYRALLAVPYVLSGAGHQAVVVFFLLSGFFIGGSVFSAVKRSQWQWSDYLLRRFVRLWIVLIPALLLCAGWDWLGMHVGHAAALYHGDVANHLVGNIQPLLAPHIFFANLFFLQVILTPTFGSDGALWSLAFEFWYYILFPLGFFALRRKTGLRQRILCIALFLAAAFFVRGYVLSYFPIWLAGAALLRVPPPRLSKNTAGRLRIAAFLVYVPVFFGLAKLDRWSLGLRDYILAAFTFGFLWILLSAKESIKPGVSASSVRGLARFSYSLYALHTPLLVFLTSLMVGDSRWAPTPGHIALALAPLAATIIYAYAIAWGTEFRTDQVRFRVEHLFGLRAAPSPLPSNPTGGGN